MTVPRRGARRAALLTSSAIAFLVVVMPLAASAAPSEGAVRACVERNSVRYLNPGSAVVAQYSDLESQCRAALEDVQVSVQIDEDTPAGPGSSGSGTPGGGTPSGSATGGSGSGGASPTTEPGASPPAESPQTSTASRIAAAALVRDAISSSDAEVGAPVSSSFGEMPKWLIGVVLGIALLAAGAVAGRVWRRSP